MVINEKILPYIQGEKFGGLVPFQIQQNGKIQDRMDFVEEIVEELFAINKYSLAFAKYGLMFYSNFFSKP